jgi:hypothetical protein
MIKNINEIPPIKPVIPMMHTNNKFNQNNFYNESSRNHNQSDKITQLPRQTFENIFNNYIANSNNDDCTKIKTK